MNWNKNKEQNFENYTLDKNTVVFFKTSELLYSGFTISYKIVKVFKKQNTVNCFLCLVYFKTLA